MASQRSTWRGLRESAPSPITLPNYEFERVWIDPPLVHHDREWKKIPESEIIGSGKSGVVVRRDDIVIKMPIRARRLTEQGQHMCIRQMLDEQHAYEVIGNERWVLPVIKMPHEEIHLPYMKNGTLAEYLNKRHPLSFQQLNWFLEIATGLEMIHKKRVLLGEWNASSIIFDDNWKPLFFNFNWAKAFPKDTPVEEMTIHRDPMAMIHSDKTVKTDIKLLGELFYEISLGHLRAMTNDPVRDILGKDFCSERVKIHLTGHGTLTGLERVLEDVTTGCLEGRYDAVDEVVDLLSPWSGLGNPEHP